MNTFLVADIKHFFALSSRYWSRKKPFKRDKFFCIIIAIILWNCPVWIWICRSLCSNRRASLGFDFKSNLWCKLASFQCSWDMPVKWSENRLEIMTMSMKEPAKLWCVICILWSALGWWRKIEIHDLFRWLKTRKTSLENFQKGNFCWIQTPSVEKVLGPWKGCSVELLVVSKLKNLFMLIFHLFCFSAPYIKQCRSLDPALAECVKGSLHHLRPWLQRGIPEIQVIQETCPLVATKSVNRFSVKGSANTLCSLDERRARSSIWSNHFRRFYGQQH